MPVKNGIDTAKEIRQFQNDSVLAKDTKLILLSGETKYTAKSLITDIYTELFDFII
jgi:hypothetical protein